MSRISGLGKLALTLTVFVVGVVLGWWGNVTYDRFDDRQFVILYNNDKTSHQITLDLNTDIELELSPQQTEKVEITNNFQEGGLTVLIDGEPQTVDLYLTKLDMTVVVVMNPDLSIAAVQY